MVFAVGWTPCTGPTLAAIWALLLTDDGGSTVTRGIVLAVAYSIGLGVPFLLVAAYRYFQTSKRKFIVADTPGHEQYTRNMVTGASTADLAIILIDARHGVVTQSRRHGFLISLLQIPHLVVAVNKMDLVECGRTSSGSGRSPGCTSSVSVRPPSSSATISKSKSRVTWPSCPMAFEAR